MILQALTQLFEDLARKGKVARPGWSSAKISYALCLTESGALESVVPLLREDPGGKKQLQPTPMDLPAAVKRTVGIQPNFLWDNSSYLLGVDEKGKPERSKECFLACAQLHHQILQGVDSPAAKAILAFFDSWQPELAQEHPALKDCWEEVMKGANLIFRVEGTFAQHDPLLRAAWDDHYGNVSGEKQQCLVTGNLDVAEPVHPAVKGVAGAQSSGAALVSFNAPAFCSYGKEQSLNAPVGKYAAFAYTAALNYLLADRENVHRIGDTTVVCWAEGAEPQYNLLAGLSIFGDTAPDGISTDNLRAAVRNLAKGIAYEQWRLDPSRAFYILGLSPNAARLSVRFFYQSSFGALMRNVNAHHARLEIVGRPRSMMPLWALLRETANQNTTDKSPSPVMAGAVARAIFTGTAYPASLLEAVMLRIRAEREITPGRAAILKAYYLKNSSSKDRKEFLTVSLNENSTNTPYVLGRLFAVMEQIQLASANWEIKRTIKDSYFSSASTTPQMVFTKLFPLNGYHIRKLQRDKPKLARKLENEEKAIIAMLSDPIPVRFKTDEVNYFYIGYYHQNFKEESEKQLKEETENV